MTVIAFVVSLLLLHTANYLHHTHWSGVLERRNGG